MGIIRPWELRQRQRASEIHRRLRAKKEIKHGGEKQAMQYQRKWRVQDTQGNMIAEPKDQKPSRPVFAAEHEYSAKNREKPDEEYPEQVIIKRTLGFELSGVVCESDEAGGYEYPTDDRDGSWTFGHTTLPC
jgi:galactose-1-phosphate uridylyltransferase